MKKPETLEQWIEFSNLSEGNINVSSIPTPILLKALNKANKHNLLMYIKKGLIMIKRGNVNYALLRAKQLITQQFKKFI